MARRTFFSFHYKNDVWRANIVRHGWVTKTGEEDAGFIDAAEFEKIKAKGEQAVQNWINDKLHGTSVTVVLIGSETSNREYVQYESKQSFKKGNGMLGVYVHGIKDREGKTSIKGSNHFGEIGKDSAGNPVYFSASYPCYDYVADDGYNNLGKWIEEAAKKAGK